MATRKAALNDLAKTPEVLAANSIWKRIEEKLNYDGRYGVLPPSAAMLRMGRLTDEESKFFGSIMGYDAPFYGGIDWEAVPTNLLEACVEDAEKGFRVLQYCHPSPDNKPLFEAVTPDECEAFLKGEITIDELKATYKEI